MSKPHVLILQVDQKNNAPTIGQSQLHEVEQLIATFGGKTCFVVRQQRIAPDKNYYIGSGKLANIKHICQEQGIDIVVCNDILKPAQLFRLEKELWSVNPGIRVFDRFDIILEIFDLHAHTTEAKLQIKLARAQHQGPRMYGLGGSELSRQGGGIGTRGKGETNVEFEKRNIKKEVQKIHKQLQKIQLQKKVRLQKRKELGIGPVALVGYTSAGKTTLFNTLTGKKKEENQSLFTTLDTVVGKMKSEKFELPILVSDTIGFISNLPHELLDSFKSTLLESLEAEIILHVVDMSDPEFKQKIQTVNEILNDLEVTQKVILICNKIDAVPETELDARVLFFKQYDHVFVSALKNEGVKELRSIIEDHFKN